MTVLEGLKVVELATYIAGPATAGVMADWGADVIKIESPAGDPHRRFFDNLTDGSHGNPVFDMDNRGKRSIVLDISKPEGREAALRLAGQADVFITNVRPAALKRTGLDWEAMHGRYPQLIYASITGYGLQGPEADKPGFDIAAFWARTGVAALTAPKGVEPFPVRTGMGDHTCSLATVSAILAAVFERGRSGQGRLVETSLMRAGVYAISTDMAIQLRLGRIASTRPREQAVNPLANFFKTADGRWLCLVPRDGGADWPAIAQGLGVADLALDPRFAKGRERRTNGLELIRLLDETFATMNLTEAGARLDAADVVWSPVLTPAELAADPQAEAAGCFVHMPDGAGGSYRAPAAPARFPGADQGPRGPSPRLGQHTQEVLLELGFEAAEIETMRAAGAAA
ncbi:MAG TPA: CaiB/BaiF CoA-transferase family protein [Caulobacteraceae bacterium]|jgi:crotonobetainyl-CoA:carnitine CoA-transferase CaiB-like acyl-CoA transferase